MEIGRRWLQTPRILKSYRPPFFCLQYPLSLVTSLGGDNSICVRLCPSVYLSVRVFFKTYLLLQFWSVSFQIYYRYQVWCHQPDLCFFWIFVNFWKFWNNGIIYSNYELHLHLRVSFNRFEIIQGSFVGYKHYGLYVFGDRTIFEFLANFWKFCNNGIIYSNCIN